MLDSCTFWSAGAAVSAAALRGWTLLLSVVPLHALSEDWREQHLSSLSIQLARSEVDVRSAAGCAAALLLDGWGAATEPESESDTDTGGQPVFHCSCVLHCSLLDACFTILMEVSSSSCHSPFLLQQPCWPRDSGVQNDLLALLKLSA